MASPSFVHRMHPQRGLAEQWGTAPCKSPHQGLCHTESRCFTHTRQGCVHCTVLQSHMLVFHLEVVFAQLVGVEAPGQPASPGLLVCVPGQLHVRVLQGLGVEVGRLVPPADLRSSPGCTYPCPCTCMFTCACIGGGVGALYDKLNIRSMQHAAVGWGACAAHAWWLW